MAKRNLPTHDINKEERVIDEKRGLVTNCLKLNVRKKPNKESQVLVVVDAGTEVIIDLNRSTRNWYNVRTESGVSGFCMSEYVNVY